MFIFFNSNLFITSSKKLILLFKESIRVISYELFAILKGIPGNPAPVPTSIILFFSLI